MLVILSVGPRPVEACTPCTKVWERRTGGRPLPFSAVEVPSPLPVPGATVMMEAWAYAP